MKYLINKLIVFLKLKNQEKFIVFLSFLILFFTSFFFKILSFKQIVKFLNFLTKKRLFNKNQKISLHKIYIIHSKCFGLTYNTSCLVKCISGKIILSLMGYKTSILNGIKFEKDKLKGHAWLSLENGEILENKDIVSQYKISFII